jgi:hypothetical protein
MCFRTTFPGSSSGSGIEAPALFPTDSNYYRTPPLIPVRSEYRQAEKFVLQRGCRQVGIDYKILYPLEYPLMHELLEASPRIRFYHPTSTLDAPAPYATDACAVVCIYCSGDSAFEKRYSKLRALDLGHIVVFYSDPSPGNTSQTAPERLHGGARR